MAGTGGSPSDLFSFAVAHSSMFSPEHGTPSTRSGTIELPGRLSEEVIRGSEKNSHIHAPLEFPPRGVEGVDEREQEQD